MPPGRLPHGWSDIVRKRWRESIGYLFAIQTRCLSVARDEIYNIKNNRVLSILTPSDLPNLSLPRSWLMGVIVCPGDATDEIAAWASLLATNEMGRVIFYIMPGVDYHNCFQAWYRAGLPNPRTEDIDGWRTLHRSFGNTFSQQIALDFQA